MRNIWTEMVFWGGPWIAAPNSSQRQSSNQKSALVAAGHAYFKSMAHTYHAETSTMILEFACGYRLHISLESKENIWTPTFHNLKSESRKCKPFSLVIWEATPKRQKHLLYQRAKSGANPFIASSFLTFPTPPCPPQGPIVETVLQGSHE